MRLLTLVGVGGVGKICLAQTLVEQAKHAFADGVLAVSLATLSQHDLLLPTLLQELGLREENAQHPRETLVAFLRAKQFLLFLDNFEQIVAAGAVLLADLLAQCPRCSWSTARLLLPHYPEDSQIIHCVWPRSFRLPPSWRISSLVHLDYLHPGAFLPQSREKYCV